MLKPLLRRMRHLARSVGQPAAPKPAQPEIIALPPSPFPMAVNYLLPLDYPTSRRDEPRWTAKSPHAGMQRLFQRFDSDYDALMALLPKHLADFQRIPYEPDPSQVTMPSWTGAPFTAIDLALLYVIVREKQPRRYIEIGSGASTLFAALAKRDGNLDTQIISIDPQPRAEVDSVCDRVVRAGFETADLSVFQEVEPGDIVYMDGSHRSFMNSDVTVFMLDVVPYLAPGVIVHFHDIHWPYDYDKSFAGWHWNEQYILAAYLLGVSDRVRIIMPSLYACLRQPTRQLLKPVIDWWPGSPDHWHYGGSLWFTHAATART